MKSKKMTGTILTALFAALISAGCFISIPLPGSVPIVIQDMLAMLSGLLLGPVYGGLSVCLFLVLGFLGLPVFSGKAGINVILAGPTGGFLIGYLAAAVVGGLVIKLLMPKQEDAPYKRIVSWVAVSAAGLSATITVFACGIPGFIRVTNMDLSKALTLVLYPFIIGNVIKLIIMILIAKKFRPIIKNYLDRQ